VTPNSEDDEKKSRGGLSRRRFTRLMAGAGLGAVLASCGEPGAGPTPGASPEASEAAGWSESPSPAPSRPATSPQPSASPTVRPTEGRPAAATATGEPPVPSLPPTEVPTPQPTLTATPQRAAYLSVARGEDPRAITRAALAAIGGIERFVKPGNDVIIKPNICVDYHTYEYAATTNPVVVAALVELCLAAGARQVWVMDRPFGGSAESAYARSGIGEAVKSAGGTMEVMNSAKYFDVEIPDGRDIRSVKVYREVLTTDVLIDVPVAKHHSLARLTLAGKNLLGVVQRPSGFHADLGQRIADLVSLVRPTLTVVDAVRILRDHGPTGGKLEDVQLTNTVIASHDIVAADAYAATLFGLKGQDVAYVSAAADMGLGTMDLGAMEIQEIGVQG
jgi:uncharacterized protein (DUF362 family)